jgi:hypothetical protein
MPKLRGDGSNWWFVRWMRNFGRNWVSYTFIWSKRIELLDWYLALHRDISTIVPWAWPAINLDPFRTSQHASNVMQATLEVESSWKQTSDGAISLVWSEFPKIGCAWSVTLFGPNQLEGERMRNCQVIHNISQLSILELCYTLFLYCNTVCSGHEGIPCRWNLVVEYTTCRSFSQSLTMVIILSLGLVRYYDIIDHHWSTSEVYLNLEYSSVVLKILNRP